MHFRQIPSSKIQEHPEKPRKTGAFLFLASSVVQTKSLTSRLKTRYQTRYQLLG